MALPSKSCFSSGDSKRTLLLSTTTTTTTVVLLVVLVICDLSHPVYPMPSSSAWSLPTLNYLFKDTKTNSQSVLFQGHESDEHLQNGGSTGYHGRSPSTSNLKPSQLESNDQKAAVSSTGRLISSHDIRLTDNWGWVRRGVSDPAQTTETRRKQNKNNIRHSKSKHKQRGSSSSSSPSSSSYLPSTYSLSGKKKDKMENLLCPFDEIRGPDGKCRKAPRFSLYRVGRRK